jgi:hypothetical protein
VIFFYQIAVASPQWQNGLKAYSDKGSCVHNNSS